MQVAAGETDDGGGGAFGKEGKLLVGIAVRISAQPWA